MMLRCILRPDCCVHVCVQGSSPRSSEGSTSCRSFICTPTSSSVRKGHTTYLCDSRAAITSENASVLSSVLYVYERPAHVKFSFLVGHQCTLHTCAPITDTDGSIDVTTGCCDSQSLPPPIQQERPKKHSSTSRRASFPFFYHATGIDWCVFPLSPLGDLWRVGFCGPRSGAEHLAVILNFLLLHVVSSRCALAGTIPQELGDLVNLKELLLHSNSLEGEQRRPPPCKVVSTFLSRAPKALARRILQHLRDHRCCGLSALTSFFWPRDVLRRAHPQGAGRAHRAAGA